uniref:Uncharacterized protein n=1 Tax=Oryza glumipatula TaxID=40148 RepID=A0A0D9ZSZ8_9ORYZ
MWMLTKIPSPALLSSPDGDRRPSPILVFCSATTRLGGARSGGDKGPVWHSSGGARRVWGGWVGGGGRRARRRRRKAHEQFRGLREVGVDTMKKSEDARSGLLLAGSSDLSDKTVSQRVGQVLISPTSGVGEPSNTFCEFADAEKSAIINALSGVLSTKRGLYCDRRNARSYTAAHTSAGGQRRAEVNPQQIDKSKAAAATYQQQQQQHREDKEQAVRGEEIVENKISKETLQSSAIDQ